VTKNNKTKKNMFFGQK